MSRPPRPVALGILAVAALAASAAAGGCSKSDGDAAPPHDRVKSGEQIYAQQCKGCHGARGEGGSGPTLRDVYKKYDEPGISAFIDAQMPLGQADQCKGDCALDVGAYVWETFRGPIVCDAPVPVARGLRLLTRREYRATVADLLGASAAGATTTPPPAGQTCGQYTFTYDPKGASLTSVHVAGAFNGWPSTIAAGGWPLAKQANGIWSLTHAVPSGPQQYKLVLNESQWILDPANPSTAPNGLGGDNSVLDASCAGGGATAGGAGAGPLDPTASFPPDTRPEGFAFDDNGPGRVVTSDLMDEYVRAAQVVASAADLGKLVTCDRSNVPACAPAFVRDFGKRAFRRPLSEAEVDRYAKVVAAAGSFDDGARAAIRALLISPSFAYRSEVGEKQPDGSYRLTPWETASALSYMYWGTMPDAALFDAAEHGKLSTTADIEREARRLLSDPRAREVVGTFAEQWLGSEHVTEITKDEAQYPFPADLRAAMREETKRFVTYVVFDGSHAVDELFTANYTFANEALAKQYGIGGVTGPELRKVPYADASRSGLLGHGSVLATTGHSDQTSPILRGLFVRRRLLCQEFPPPPPNAGGVPKVDPKATTRERFAQHTANPFCKSCHQYIDDVGFGFERFDTIGRARDMEAGQPIDAHGDMNDVEGLGTNTHAPYASLRDLGHVLASSEAAKACVVRQVYRFTRGRKDDDVCQVKPLAQRFAEKGGDLRELLVAVATDPAFVTRQ